ncbi:unnamed protein product [Prorocentrum cordatum]|uniref:Uncharacterized protein n=1 Tax=Prorocentrum cordatum TaxID=2364126 RepID=A0ABN9VXF1_9DINO|nr:unnamed protein product [Polarella glacialis]
MARAVLPSADGAGELPRQAGAAYSQVEPLVGPREFEWSRSWAQEAQALEESIGRAPELGGDLAASSEQARPAARVALGVLCLTRRTPLREICADLQEFMLMPFFVPLLTAFAAAALCQACSWPFRVEADVPTRRSEPAPGGVVQQAHPRALVTRVARYEFKLISSGLCQDTGWSIVADSDTCEAAAKQLQLDGSHVTITTEVGVPDGCYYRNGSSGSAGALFLSTSPLNRGSRDYQSDVQGEVNQRVCSQTVAASFTREQAQDDARQQIAFATSMLMVGKVDGLDVDVPVREGSKLTAFQAPAPHGSADTTVAPTTTTAAPATSKAPHGRANTTGAGTTGANTTGANTTGTNTTGTNTTSKVPPSNLPVAVAVKPLEIIKAIGYAPVPLRGVGEHLPNDDFMQANTSALWGPDGRQDLSIMRSLGANAVRLYGNDPSLDHGSFLDEAQKEGLEVIAGMSDYAYTQMYGSCKDTEFDCYRQIKEQYLANLKGGFLQDNGHYHPALKVVVLINEPDLKLSHDSGVVASPEKFCKAIVSAFDAVLDAEKEVRALGPAPNFSATFSYGVCYECAGIDKTMPAYGQMRELRKAMKKPSSVGYAAKNNLWAAYHERFVNSVNTENRAEDYQEFFQLRYDAEFQGTPVFLGEYHAPPFDQVEDLQSIIKIAENRSSLLTGLSFFEFQTRYDKGGVGEMSFGMFGLGDTTLGSFNMYDKEVQAYCLTSTRAGVGNHVVHHALAKAFNGSGLKSEDLCPGTPADMI